MIPNPVIAVISEIFAPLAVLLNGNAAIVDFSSPQKARKAKKISPLNSPRKAIV